jgi:hypothetical protein
MILVSNYIDRDDLEPGFRNDSPSTSRDRDFKWGPHLAIAIA